jgi:hypothetical protein
MYLALIALLSAFVVLWRPKVTEKPKNEITSFEQCAAAGNPVMESYPRQCRTPDGLHFVETIIPEQ